MLKILAEFEDNLYTEKLLEVEKVPCLCRISKIFEIDFLVANPQSTGIVTNWNHKDIDLRIPAGAGGKYTHYSYGLITLLKEQTGIYIIKNLEMFDLWENGWKQIIQDCEYTDVPEVEEPDWLREL